MEAHGGPIHAASVFVSSRSFVHVYFKGLVFLVFSNSACSYILPDFFLMKLAESWGEVFREDVPFRAEYSKDCHCLSNIRLWFSTFVPTCCRRWLLWRWLSRHWSTKIVKYQWVNSFIFFYTSIVVFLPLIPSITSLRLLVNWTVPSLGSLSWSGS